MKREYFDELASRRAFLRIGATGVGAAAIGSAGLWGCSKVDAGLGEEPSVDAIVARARGTLVGPGSWAKEDDEETHYILSVIDLDRPDPEITGVPLDFMGHGLAIDPNDLNRAVIFEKRGSGACVVDLATMSYVQPIETSEDRQFYGHGAFSPDGKLLYATETDLVDGYKGLMVVRDAATLKELGTFPSYGESPHDCVLRDDGKTFVITNGGSHIDSDGAAPSVTYVDVASEKLIERIEFESPLITAGHLFVTEAGDLAVVSAQREGMPKDALGAISLRPASGIFRTMTEPAEVTARMKGETLSVAVHAETGIVGATNPRGNVVTFWEMETGRFVKSLDLSFPRGIALTLDGRSFMVSFGQETSVVEVPLDTLEPLPSTRLRSTLMSGSHVIVHRLPSA